jgi:hypothetical protein
MNKFDRQFFDQIKGTIRVSKDIRERLDSRYNYELDKPDIDRIIFMADNAIKIVETLELIYEPFLKMDAFCKWVVDANTGDEELIHFAQHKADYALGRRNDPI